MRPACDEFWKFRRAAAWRPGWTPERGRNGHCAGSTRRLKNPQHHKKKAFGAEPQCSAKSEESYAAQSGHYGVFGHHAHRTP